MTAEPIDVAVVGVGHLGRHHARLYAANPAARLVAVVDRDGSRAREIAAQFGCEAFDDPARVVGRVRAASIAVPTADHVRVAEPLLRAGLDLLIEKPVTRSLAEADALADAAQASGALVMVGHSERFNPAVAALLGELDSPRFFEVHRLAAFSARSTDIDVVLDLMIHDLDLVLHIDGTEAIGVDAVGVAALTDMVDIANARIRLASGCVANLTASRVSAEPLRRIRVFQARTYLACDTGRRTVDRFRLVAEGDAEPRIVQDRLEVAEGEPLALEIAAFLGSVRDRVTPAVDLVAARRALELAHRVCESIALGAGGR